MEDALIDCASPEMFVPVLLMFMTNAGGMNAAISGSRMGSLHLHGNWH